jgi:tRNA(Ile)-lysidine synthase
MLETVQSFIEQQHLLPESGTVVVAVSGGADSLCLLHLLHRLCGPGNIYPTVRLHVAHLDHQLRPEVSAEEAARVAQIATSWGLSITIGKEDVPTLARVEQRSLEDAARVARYRFLRHVAQGAPIAVAHHQDDQVETLLLHWLRGGGMSSMVGLQARQHDIIRPLLVVTHADTLAYCQQYQLTPIEDASNNDLRFLRNRIRHELLPLLESMNPGIRATLLRNAEVMHVDAAWIEQQVDDVWPTVVLGTDTSSISLNIPALLLLPRSLQRHVLRRAASLLCDGQSPLELRHYVLIEQLLQRTPSREAVPLDLPHNLRATRNGDILVVGARCIAPTARLIGRDAVPMVRLTKPPISPDQSGMGAIHRAPTLPVPGRVEVPGTGWMAVAEVVPAAEMEDVWRLLAATRYVVYVDADTIADSLTVRTRRPGDRMRPLGMKHEKKVQDILVDKHIVRAERDSLPLFFSHERCIWLASVCLDERVRLTSETRRIVRLSILSTQEYAGIE